MTIGTQILAACQGFRKALEGDCLPTMHHDKHSTIDGMAAVCYQPCLYSLNRVIQVYEQQNSAWWARIAQQVATLALVALTSLVAAVGFLLKRIGSILPQDKTQSVDTPLTSTVTERVDEVSDAIQRK